MHFTQVSLSSSFAESNGMLGDYARPASGGSYGAASVRASSSFVSVLRSPWPLPRIHAGRTLTQFLPAFLIGAC
jgi:hypothetical protein